MAGEMRRIAFLAAFALLAAAPAAQAIPHLPPDPAPVAGNANPTAGAYPGAPPVAAPAPR